ncbi:hypothetical protein ILYODFUR_010313 [Ilyodon furcidens]|uniref:Secreted protein n=1 Tax=Ilyodon furcidens TaxID=33524 RepID=A0ABV0SK21_9TELE
MTGTAPILSSVAWLTAYECVWCPCEDVTTGLRLTVPLLRTMAVGDGAEFVVTTRVLGGESMWPPFANDVVVVVAIVGGGWRVSGVEPGAVAAVSRPCVAF